MKIIFVEEKQNMPYFIFVDMLMHRLGLKYVLHVWDLCDILL
jgi:hypothetical protein